MAYQTPAVPILIRELRSVQSAAIRLEREVQREMRDALLALPGQFGLNSVDELIAVLKPLRRARARTASSKKNARAGRKKAGGTGKRLSAEGKAALVADIKSKSLPTSQIIAKHGISSPTFYLYKRKVEKGRQR